MTELQDSDGKLISSIAAILNLLLIAIPKDLWRWLNLKPKCVRDQVILITGAASGLGQRMAEIFALELGAKVAILDIDELKAKVVANDICKKGGIAHAWKCDVSDANSVNRAAFQVKKILGTIDIAICNAGILYFGQTLQLKIEEFQHALNINVMGTINTIRTVLYEMETRNSGQIVGISSIAGYYGETFGMAYCPTKFAVRGVMECLRMEMLDKKMNGIICTTVCPYFVRTPMILNKGMRPTSRLISFMSIERCSRKIIDSILKEKVLAFVPSWICLMPMITTLLSINMLKTARDYLNCHYEPLRKENYKCDQCGKTIKSSSADILVKEKKKVLNNEKEKQINNLCCCSTITSNNESNISKNSPVFMKNNSENSSINNDLKLLNSSKMANFYRAPNFIWYFIIPPGLALTFFVWYSPEIFNVPYLDWLHYLGTKHSHLFLGINIVAWIVHFAEAYWAFIICSEFEFTHVCGLKWFLQTFILGYPSLKLITAYRAKKNLSK